MQAFAPLLAFEPDPMSTAHAKTVPMPLVATSIGLERSQECGSATRSKKNPGKRPSQGAN